MLIPAISAVILLLFTFLAYNNRVHAFALFVAMLPVYLVRLSFPLPGIGAFPTTLLELCFLALFGMWLWLDTPWRDWPKHRLQKWVPGLALLAIGGTIGMLVSPSLRSGAGLWRAYIIEPILFFPMAVALLRSPKERRLVLAALATLIGVIGLTAIYQKITGDGITNLYWQAVETRRVTSFFGFPNGIGLLAAPVVTLLAGWSVTLLSKRRWLSFAFVSLATLLGALGILFAESEGAMIGVAAGLVILGTLLKPTRKIALIAIIIGSVTIMAYEPLLDYSSRIASLRDSSGAVRKIVWTESLAMLDERPVFGAGLAGYPTALLPYHNAKHIEIFQYPHSILINFWTETTLIGLAGFVWLIWQFFASTISLIRRHENEWLPPTLLAAMFALLVHGLVDVPYFKNDLAFLFILLLAFVASMESKKSTK